MIEAILLLACEHNRNQKSFSEKLFLLIVQTQNIVMFQNNVSVCINKLDIIFPLDALSYKMHHNKHIYFSDQDSISEETGY
jgi:hypothetical protein